MSLMRKLLAFIAPPTLAFGGGASASPPPPPDTKNLVPPMLQSPAGMEAADAVKKRAAANRGYGGTIVTGGQGVITPANTSQKQLLGA